MSEPEIPMSPSTRECDECGGYGTTSYITDVPLDCPRCHGTGRIEEAS